MSITFASYPRLYLGCCNPYFVFSMKKVCGGCQLDFEDAEALREHRIEEHPYRFSGAGYCAFCSAGFDSIFEFFDHLIETHDEQWNQMAKKMDQVTGIELRDLEDHMPLVEAAYRSSKADSQEMTMELVLEDVRQRLLAVLGANVEREVEEQRKKDEKRRQERMERKRKREEMAQTVIQKEPEPDVKRPHEETIGPLLTPVSQSPCTSHSSPAGISSIKVEEEELEDTFDIDPDMFHIDDDTAEEPIPLFSNVKDEDQSEDTPASGPISISPEPPVPASQLRSLIAEVASNKINTSKKQLSNNCSDDRDAAFFRGISESSQCPRCDLRFDSKVTKRYHFLQFHYEIYFTKVRMSDSERELTEFKRFLGMKLGQQNEAPRVCRLCDAWPNPKGRAKMLIHLKKMHREEFDRFRIEYFRLATLCAPQVPDSYIHVMLNGPKIMAVQPSQ